MMELIKQRLKNIRLLVGLAILVILLSCKRESSNGKLECILESVKIEKKDLDIIVGQHNRWTDSSSLIVILFEEKNMNISNNSKLKGKYSQNDIYYNQGNIDTLDKKKYRQISNSIKWQTHVPHEMEKDYISPPYDPINIQIEYDLDKDCIIDIIRGKGFIDSKTISQCKCNT
ncbi:MAG: hypothetical protein R2774_06865 [Saprospiraceae bacterium]